MCCRSLAGAGVANTQKPQTNSHRDEQKRSLQAAASASSGLEAIDSRLGVHVLGLYVKNWRTRADRVHNDAAKAASDGAVKATRIGGPECQGPTLHCMSGIAMSVFKRRGHVTNHVRYAGS